MDDLVKRLNEYADALFEIGQFTSAGLVQESSLEIQRLRSLAGAVSAGPTAAETLAPLRHKPPESHEPQS